MAQKTHGIIAAGHPKTAEAGVEMLRQGGNAFDAAAAAILASFVAESTLTSAAGGGFLLAHTQDNQNILFDFFTQTPGRKKPESELNFEPVIVNFGVALQEFHIGLGSMAVPANLAGVFYVHKKLGRLPLKAIVEPAIHYAQNGIELNAFQAYCLTLLHPIMLASEESRKIYAPKGKLVQAGEQLLFKDFANTLSDLAKQGAKKFYEGEIAHQIVQDCQNLGGHLTLEDFKNYRVIERQPLHINYRGNTLLTNPPPSSGGTLIAFALKLLSYINFENINFGSTRHLQILADVMRLTNEARTDGLDGKLYQSDIAETFLNSSHLSSSVHALSQLTNKWGSTTHISVVDSEGNAASVTTSNGEGSGYVIPGTGIMVNNMLGEDDLNPQGFHRWHENVRMSSMMAPTIVLKNHQPEIVLGSGGSKRIRTAILQVISNILDFKMPVDAAVDSPRIHWENNVLNLEPAFETKEIKNLELTPQTQLVEWQEKNMFFGGVHTILETSEGEISGAGDRRRGGVSLKI